MHPRLPFNLLVGLGIFVGGCGEVPNARGAAKRGTPPWLAHGGGFARILLDLPSLPFFFSVVFLSAFGFLSFACLPAFISA